MQTKWFCLIKKINVNSKSFVVLGKTDLRLSIFFFFEPNSVQSQQFQTLAALIIMPAQHMNPVD